jgi:large subunit ribosomal protein L10
MSLSPAQKLKQKIVQEIEQKVDKSKGVLFFEYHGLKVDEINTLREKISEGEGEVKVYKNTLFKKALEKAEYKDDVVGELTGPIACAFSYADITPIAKAIVGFKKENEESLPLKVGVLLNKKISAAEIKEISKLPAREVLLAKLVGTLAAPVQAFVSVLSAVPRDFVYALGAIKDKKG